MIGPIEGQPVRLERSDPATKAGTEQSKDAPGQVRRADRVEISAEAREKAAAGLGQVEGLSPERVAELRQRMADGTYNQPGVIEEVARRMIEQEDV